jgi:thaumarchaeosortase
MPPINLIETVKSKKPLIQRILLPSMLIIYTLLIYCIFPESLLQSWKGRYIYLIFTFTIILEVILLWNKLSLKSNLKNWIFGTTALLLPLFYIVYIYYLAHLDQIINLGRIVGVPSIADELFLIYHWPITFELIFFSIFIIAYMLLTHGLTGIKQYSVALTLLLGTTIFFTIDTFFPFARFYPLQILVPATTYPVASLITFFGYKVQVFYGSVIYVEGRPDFPLVSINWPCAGIHSLMIYTAVMFLFLKNLNETRAWKIVVFGTGALGTFLANIFRILTFLLLGLKYGTNVANLFHDYYGELFFLCWIMIYFPILVYGRIFTNKIISIIKFQNKDNIR